MGTHQELLDKQGYYFRLYQMQFNAGPKQMWLSVEAWREHKIFDASGQVKAKIFGFS